MRRKWCKRLKIDGKGLKAIIGKYICCESKWLLLPSRDFGLSNLCRSRLTVIDDLLCVVMVKREGGRDFSLRALSGTEDHQDERRRMMKTAKDLADDGKSRIVGKRSGEPDRSRRQKERVKNEWKGNILLDANDLSSSLTPLLLILLLIMIGPNVQMW